MLLDRKDCGEITSEVIDAGALNQNEKVLGLLLDRGRSSRISTEAINRAIENRNEKILSLLLDNGYMMSQTLVNKAAANGSASNLRLLLDRGGAITGLVLRCAAGNDLNGAKMMSFLLAEAKDWMITEELTEMMKIAARSGSEGPGIIKPLLERAGDVLITEDVLMTAANNPGGNELIKMFSRKDWEMTEEVLEAMMSRLAYEETLQLILDRVADLEITEKILLAAASNRFFGDQLVGLLLDRVDRLVLLDSVLLEAAGNYEFGLEVILLLQRRAGRINVTREALERAAREGSMRTMKFLLDHTSAPITEAVIIGAIMGCDLDKELEKVQLLLDRATDLPITRQMVHTAARYSCLGCLALIWQRACRIEMTEDVTEDVTRDLAQAAISGGMAVQKLRFLLDAVENLVVGPESLVSMVRKRYDEIPLLNLFIDRGIKLQITQDVLRAAAGNHRDDRSLMTILLERSEKATLTDELFRAAAGSGGVGILQVLSEFCGLAEVPTKWLELARLHDAVKSSSRDSIDDLVSFRRSIDYFVSDNDFHLNSVRELLAKGVEPNVPDGEGLTPVMHAAALGNILTVQALLSAGANPNSKDMQGRTPLFFAASGGHYGIVETLLDLGVPTHLEDEQGDTPSSMDKRFGHMRIFRLLERRRQP